MKHVCRSTGPGSCTDELFGTPEIQKASESGNATDARGEAQDVPTMDDLTNEQAPEYEDNASDKHGDECAAAESEEEIMDETIQQSPMENQTRSKSRMVILPEAFMCSDSEDEPPRQQPRKCNCASPAQLRTGGHAKYFQRKLNQFLSIASKKLTANKRQAGGRGRK